MGDVDNLVDSIKAGAERVTTLAVIEAERAVVEAARVLMKRCNPVVMGKRVGPLNEMLYLLKEAVEALERAEGGS
jgi:hypothetical protein